jgi:hypothetical protein
MMTLVFSFLWINLCYSTVTYQPTILRLEEGLLIFVLSLSAQTATHMMTFTFVFLVPLKCAKAVRYYDQPKTGTFLQIKKKPAQTEMFGLKRRTCADKRERTALFWVITQRVVVIPYRRFGTNYRSHPQGSSFFYSWAPRMGLIGCPDTSVRYYHYSLGNTPEERISQLLRGGSLISRRGRAVALGTVRATLKPGRLPLEI